MTIFKRILTCSAILLTTALLTTPAIGQIAYDEASDGDLNGNFGSPTSIIFSIGANSVLGQVGNNGNTGATNGQDADYFTFTIGSGQSLDSVIVDNYVASTGSGPSFSAYTVGSSFGGQTGGDIDGSLLFNSASGDILDNWAGGPLAAGDYSVWLQETSAITVDYTLTFNVSSAVPEPSSLVILGFGSFAGLIIRRRKS